MKKMTMLFLSLFVFLVACQNTEEGQFDPDENLDLENVFFDDFNEGIDINNWEIINQKWGKGNNGVVPENVNYTSDGIVVLQANGDNYAGNIKGYDSNSGLRTGSALASNESFGPGRFEVRMKALPRFGATSAFWTYYYNETLSLNQEIDIELNVNNNFRTIWTTNWTTLTDSDHREIDTDIVNNDGEFHIYKFEWHTNPARIDYYVDDLLLYTSYTNIPTYAGRLWIGNWFPDSWAGTPDFETDYMFVDWIRYTPYLNNEYIATEGGRSNFPDHYPTSPIEIPLNNLVSNPGFEGLDSAWRKEATSNVAIVDNEGVDKSKAIFVPKSNITYQFITGLDDTFVLELTAKAKISDLNGGGYIYLEFRPLETILIDSKLIKFDPNEDAMVVGEYFEKTITITLPKGTRRIELSLISDGDSGIYFDDLYLNLSNKK